MPSTTVRLTTTIARTASGRALAIPLPRRLEPAAVHTLPAELLIEIFSYLKGPPGQNKDIIQASHVCTRWYDVAISASELWCAFKLDNIEQTATYLQRSNVKPLTVKLAPPTVETDIKPVLELLRPHVYRLKSILIDCLHRGHLDAVIGQLHDDPAPVLETLILRLSAVDAIDETEDHTPLFGGVFPNLRYLAVLQIPYKLWYAPAPLTTLHIGLNALLPMDDLTRVIATYQTLVELEVLTPWAPPDAPFEDRTDASEFDMPNLQRVTLAVEPAIAAHTLLSGLRIPPSATLALTLNVDDEDIFRIAQMPFAHGAGMQRLSVAWPANDQLHIQAWRSLTAPAGSPANVECRMYYLGEERAFQRGLGNALVGTSELRLIDLILLKRGDVEELKYLGAYPNLEALRVVAPPLEVLGGLCDALMHMDAAEANQDDDGDVSMVGDAEQIGCYCPRLHTLIIAGIDADKDAVKDLMDAIVLQRAQLTATSPIALMV